MNDRIKEIIKLRKQGLTYKAIGKRLGVTKVAIYQQLKKADLTDELNPVKQIKLLQKRVTELEERVEKLEARFKPKKAIPTHYIGPFI